MEKNYLDRKILKIWHICASFLFVPMFIICTIFTILLDYIYPVIIFDVLFLGILFFFCYPYETLNYNRYTYSYDKKRIVIKRGVIFKSEIIIPVCQIQDLHLNQGPLMQLAKIVSIEISTAGSNYSIKGIATNDANLMISFLEEKLNERIEEIKNEKIYEEINIQ